MNTTSNQDLRHFSRVPFGAEVLLHLQGRTITVHLVDIALKGALVQTPTLEALVPQEKCRLVLTLADGSDSIVMTGEIVHIEDRYVGIKCVEIDVNSLTQLRRLIELNTGDPDLMNREISHLFVHR